MKDWYSTIYKACIFSSVIAFILGFMTDSKTSLGAYMAGYSVLILAVLMILTILFNNVLKVTANDSTFQILYSILMTAGPFILILGVISFVLYLLITYKDNIIDGKIAPGYNSFSNIIIMLLLVQLYMVYTNINTEKFENTGKIPKITSGIIYLLGVITSICSIILYTILKYFSTDGFRNIN
jgi:hypothetical protein